jgi:hypothetical protein
MRQAKADMKKYQGKLSEKDQSINQLKLQLRNSNNQNQNQNGQYYYEPQIAPVIKKNGKTN